MIHLLPPSDGVTRALIDAWGLLGPDLARCRADTIPAPEGRGEGTPEADPALFGFVVHL
jgi:hypothetical protein